MNHEHSYHKVWSTSETKSRQSADQHHFTSEWDFKSTFKSIDVMKQTNLQMSLPDIHNRSWKKCYSIATPVASYLTFSCLVKTCNITFAQVFALLVGWLWPKRSNRWNFYFKQHERKKLGQDIPRYQSYFRWQPCYRPMEIADFLQSVLLWCLSFSKSCRQSLRQ